jgi:hypothetical protein
MIYIVSLRGKYIYFQDYCESLMANQNIQLLLYDNMENISLNTNDMYIFCQIIPECYLKSQLRYKLCLLNTEQLSANIWECEGIAMPKIVQNILNLNIPVIDYDLYQSRIFGLNSNYHYIPYQYYSQENEYLSELVQNMPKIYDVAFCSVGASKRRTPIYTELIKRGLKVIDVTGWKNERDAKIAHAKILINIHYNDDFLIFEHMRCDRWILAGQIVVSEISLSDDILDFKDLVEFSKFDDIVDKICNIVTNYDVYASCLLEKIKNTKTELIKQRRDTLIGVVDRITEHYRKEHVS